MNTFTFKLLERFPLRQEGHFSGSETTAAGDQRWIETFVHKTADPGYVYSIAVAQLNRKVYFYCGLLGYLKMEGGVLNIEAADDCLLFERIGTLDDPVTVKGRILALAERFMSHLLP